LTWEARLREAAYTSPLGGRIAFQYTDVSRSTPLRNAAFDFGGINGSYVQPNGYSATQYPMRCYFSGDDCDLQATLFEELLLDKGVGQLEHPLYGRIDVVPFGTVERNDALATAANQAVVETVFYKTLGAIYPSAQSNPRSEIDAGIFGFNGAAAAQFADVTDLRGAIAQANTKATVTGFLGYVSAALAGAAAATTAVNQQFRADQAAINGGIDVLIGQPLQLALQVSNLIQDPSRAAAGIASRLVGYRNLANSIIASTQASGASDATTLDSLRLKLSNDFATCDLFAFSAVSGSVSAALNNTFTTKPEALSAASEIAAQLDAVVTWRDGRFGGLGQVDPGGSYQALQQLVAITLGYLVESSFSLATERRIVLDRPRTIVDLCAELYGTVDDKLDFLIDTNGLTGADILELPRGRAVVWYS
jgi:prophage DNA circulation protein